MFDQQTTSHPRSPSCAAGCDDLTNRELRRAGAETYANTANHHSGGDDAARGRNDPMTWNITKETDHG
jgi:hypothetical protein